MAWLLHPYCLQLQTVSPYCAILPLSIILALISLEEEKEEEKEEEEEDKEDRDSDDDSEKKDDDEKYYLWLRGMSTMAGELNRLMGLWNQWATQILVLLSLTLQVVLHVLAGVRRRETTDVRRILLWLAYQLADTTAIYTVGHLSLSSAPREHKLVVPRDKSQHFYIKYEHPHHQDPDQGVDDEFLLQRAHSLFHVCKRGIVDSVIDGDGDQENPDTRAISDLFQGEKYQKSMWTVVTVMQMELSLMYDILYTKANVIHTYSGYGIRAMAPLAVVTSLLLFHFSGKGGHNIVDIAITYVLLSGALILEIKSPLSSLGSTWALSFLCATRWSWLRHVALCSGRWYRLRRALVSLRRPAMSMTSGSSRKWKLTMGQYNMMLSCARQVNTTSGWFNDWSMFWGMSDWLDRKHCSRNIPVPDMVVTRLQKMLKQIFKLGDLNTMGLLRRKWGKHAMSMSSKKDRAKQFEETIKKFHGVDFHESVLIWHLSHFAGQP
ncbi:hypothetical protein ABZP36_004394 [Zizania latifolia]